jgi:deazaflavin-dependent oxidoreductase (nitroreductase family)
MDMKTINQHVIEQFRAGGPIDGMHRERLILLTTVGARSGQQRTTPMMFHQDGGQILVVASNMGADQDPNWYRNLRADPQVAVEIGNEKYHAIARTVEGPERDRLWTILTTNYPFFADHQAQVARTIPVVSLEQV